MVYLSVFVLLFFSSSVLSKQVKLLTACSIHNTDCLSKNTKEVLKKTSSGIPEYNIKSLDPLFIPHLDVTLNETSENIFHFNNLTITGLKDQEFSFIRLNKKEKTVILQTKADLNIVGKVTIEMKKTAKSLTGSYSANGTALGTANFNYDIKKDNKRVKHFELGPETNECQNLFGPQVTYGKELVETLEKDKGLQGRKQQFNANQKEIEQRIFCEIVSYAYKTVVQNIRAAAKILPTSAFLKGF